VCYVETKEREKGGHFVLKCGEGRRDTRGVKLIKTWGGGVKHWRNFARGPISEVFIVMLSWGFDVAGFV